MSWFNWKEAPPADFAVIGDPVNHSLSPSMHHAAYQALNLKLTYTAIQIPQEEFTPALNHLKNLGYQGLNVTVPLKEAAHNWCQSISGPAQTLKINAINTINLNTKTGINTDIPGFLQTLKANNISPGKALILGAGGTAQALAPALVQEGYQVTIWNRTQSKAEQIAQTTPKIQVLSSPDPTNCQLILNTTSASLQGETIPINFATASPNALAYDAMYSPHPTPFLQQAQTANLRILDGRELLVEQGALAFEWWLNIPAPRTAMMKVVYERLSPHP